MNIQDLRAKVKKISNVLEEELGIPEPLDKEPPLDVLIHTILSQNTNDTNSGRAYENLRDRFPDWEDILGADAADISEVIKVGGLARQKSIRIKETIRWIKENYGKLDIDFVCEMSPDDVIETFTKLKGIGLKTVNVMLCFACGMDVFPVDTHIFRVSRRLDLIPQNASPEKAHEIMGQIFPEGKAFSLHVNMINFGRTICHAQKPKCRECPLIEYCIAWREFINEKNMDKRR